MNAKDAEGDLRDLNFDEGESATSGLYRLTVR